MGSQGIDDERKGKEEEEEARRLRKKKLKLRIRNSDTKKVESGCPQRVFLFVVSAAALLHI